MNRRFILAVATSFLAFIPAAPSNADTKIRFATEAAYPPFNYRTPDGKVAGFDVDIAMAACEKMKRECEFVIQDWDGIIAGLLVSKYDGIFSSMGITADRRKQLEFSDPYYRSGASFAAADGTEIDITDPKLGGKSVGTVTGIFQCYVEKHFPDADHRLYANSDALYLDLEAGRIDVVFNGTIALKTSILKETDSGYRLIGPDHKDPACLGEGYGVGLRQGSTELRDALNRAFAEMRADGTYQAINAKYFAFDIFQ